MGKNRILLRDPDEGISADPGQVITGVSGSVFWSPTGGILIVSLTGRRTGFVSLDSHIISTGFDGIFASFAPDEKWVAYQNSQSGQPEVYIRSYPDGKMTRQVSISGGFEPRWKASGELFYRNGNRWFSTHVSTTPVLRWDPPRIALETEFIDTPGMSYDVTPDGQRLLVVKRAQAITAMRIDVLLNWLEMLKAKQVK
jgi:hypothetical protein